MVPRILGVCRNRPLCHSVPSLVIESSGAVTDAARDTQRGGGEDKELNEGGAC